MQIAHRWRLPQNMTEVLTDVLARHHRLLNEVGRAVAHLDGMGTREVMSEPKGPASRAMQAQCHNSHRRLDRYTRQ